MKIRPMVEADEELLREWHASAGLEYDFPDLGHPNIAGVYVVEDEAGKPIMACAAEKILQLYLLCGEGVRPEIKLAAISGLHETMTVDLRKQGYSEANCFVPPLLAKAFGRRLMKTFGWSANWPSWAKRF